MVKHPVRSLAKPAVTFWGAAQSVTGSMHLVEVGDFKVLLDCGLVKGSHPEAHDRNRHFPFNPADIDAVILSHAHIDHCGNLPTLVRQGFSGPIYCTPPTHDLLAVMLADSAKIQEEDAFLINPVGNPEEPSSSALYTRHDAWLTAEHCIAIPYERDHALCPDLQLRFVDAGHILGSAMVALRLDGGGRDLTITYTGDLGRRGLPYLRDPAPIPAADLIICESTYGGRFHTPLEQLAERLQTIVRQTVERGGKVLIPAFSLGRAQVVVHFLRQWVRSGRLPRVPIFVDSPLAGDVAQVYFHHPECLAEEAGRELTEAAPGEEGQAERLVHYLRSPQESSQVSTQREPCVIVASGGMCEGGRILQHLQNNIDDPRSTIVLVSYQAPNTVGRRLLERGPRVKFLGRNWNKWADVVDLNGFSSHADHNDFLTFLAPLAGQTRSVQLVHGELEQAEALAGALRERGFGDVGIPKREETVSLM
jgi:metallo-beta-lactamase family protein